MPQRRIRLTQQLPQKSAAEQAPALATLRARFEEIRLAADVTPEFPPAVTTAAEAAAKGATEAATESGAATDSSHVDLTHIEFVTIDPEGSTDLDQALYLEQDGTGFRVWYAIADVPHFVPLHGEVDAEAMRRGSTIYCPDMRVPLHPPVLSEAAASLLADQVRPAFVWCIDLDTAGEVSNTTLTRALVRSRAQLAYSGVQADLDAGQASPMLQLLPVVGELRRACEARRGGASLNVPEAEVRETDAGYHIEMRGGFACEADNAQISLLTGMCAAKIMIDGKVGILRTMPPAERESLDRLRAVAAAHGVEWPATQAYGDFLRTLDPAQPRDLALLHQATALFRGAGYLVLDGELPASEDLVQSAIAAPYAHTTAPLRRLVDRFVLLVCHALTTGGEVSQELRARLAEVPEVMAGAARLASQIDRDCLDAVEAAIALPLVGQTLQAVVVSPAASRSHDAQDDPAKAVKVKVQTLEPPILASVTLPSSDATKATVTLGDVVSVRVESADIATGLVHLALV